MGIHDKDLKEKQDGTSNEMAVQTGQEEERGVQLLSVGLAFCIHAQQFV